MLREQKITMNPIYLTYLSIRDLGGFTSFEHQLGQINLIIGENSSGKSTILDCISLFFEAGANRDLLRRGCTSGEAKVKFSNGYAASMVLELKEDGAVDYDLKVYNPDGGEIGAAVTQIKKWLPRGSFNPVKFLELDATEMAEYLVKYLGLRFTGSRVNEALQTRYGQLDPPDLTLFRPAESIDLEKFDARVNEIESARGLIWQKQRDLKGIIRQAQDDLGTESDADWAAERDRLQGEIARAEVDISTVKRTLTNEATNKKLELRRASDEYCRTRDELVTAFVRDASDFARTAERIHSPMRPEHHLEFVEAAASLNERVQTLNIILSERDVKKNLTASMLSDIDTELAEEIRLKTASQTETTAKLSLELGTAREKARDMERIKATRRLIDKTEKELEGETLRYEQLTQVLDALERLKVETLKSLPIEGLDIKYQKRGAPTILINGKSLHGQTNRTEQLFVAFKILWQAQKGSDNPEQLPMFLCETAEITDSYLPSLEAACKKIGAQLFVTRPVAGAELRIETR
jgi:energy-coupling factor transporter ATP-binding protein EcfA2